MEGARPRAAVVDPGLVRLELLARRLDHPLRLAMAQVDDATVVEGGQRVRGRDRVRLHADGPAVTLARVPVPGDGEPPVVAAEPLGHLDARDGRAQGPEVPKQRLAVVRASASPPADLGGCRYVADVVVVTVGGGGVHALHAGEPRLRAS